MNSRSAASFPQFEPRLYSEVPKSRYSGSACAAALSVFAVVTFAGTLYHCAWRDEAFVWLLARDLSLGALFRELKYNSVTGLWHTFIFVLAKSGFPYQSQQYLHWAIACLAGGILLYKSPFSLSLRILILFSYFIFFENAIVARVFLISILLLYLICILYPNKLQWPVSYGCLVALLANANAFGLVAAALFGANYLFAMLRTRSFSGRHWLAGVIMMVGGVVSAISVWPPSDGFSYNQQLMPLYAPWNAVTGPTVGFFGIEINDVDLQFLLGTASLGILALTVVILWSRAAYFPLLLLVAMWSLIAYLTVFQYPWSSARHYCFYFIFTITALWLASTSGPSRSVAAESALSVVLSIALVVSFIAGANAYRDEFAGRPFSGSKALAAFIRDHQLENRILVGYPATYAAAVLPYLPGLKMWYPQLESFGTYIHMAPPVRQRLDESEIATLVASHFPNSNDVLYVFNRPLKPGILPLKLLASFDGKREEYWLYEAQSNEPK